MWHAKFRWLGVCAPTIQLVAIASFTITSTPPNYNKRNRLFYHCEMCVCVCVCKHIKSFYLLCHSGHNYLCLTDCWCCRCCCYCFYSSIWFFCSLTFFWPYPNGIVNVAWKWTQTHNNTPPNWRDVCLWLENLIQLVCWA